ncbi:hypothetical protein PAHAL_3G459900 [Panicum hallii]|uniref:Uncharacterized protein n=1 Tax=Panicum hallii TaxID=206008 RepID=A0A2T8KLL9_9POAL|nr:hypothetical protein PAHAL_3G459900 [Panicum hallii]
MRKAKSLLQHDEIFPRCHVFRPARSLDQNRLHVLNAAVTRRLCRMDSGTLGESRLVGSDSIT